MKLGILAYGSLIESPGSEIEAVTSDVVRGVQTPFHVEFARSSTTRGGAPTLVPVDEGGAKVQAIIYSVNTDIAAASSILYRREIHAVGTGKIYREQPSGKLNTVYVERFENFGDHDMVLSTRIGANIQPLTAERLAELAIGSARRIQDGTDGISYLIAAKGNGIVTALSPAYETEILSRLNVAHLKDALTAVRELPTTPTAADRR